MFRTGKALASTLTRSLGAVLAGVFLGMPIYDPIRLWGEAQSSRNPMRSSRWTHRYDESGRVFLAGCSPAEPASASSTFQHIQKAELNQGAPSLEDCSRAGCPENCTGQAQGGVFFLTSPFIERLKSYPITRLAPGRSTLNLKMLKKNLASFAGLNPCCAKESMLSGVKSKVSIGKPVITVFCRGSIRA